MILPSTQSPGAPESSLMNVDTLKLVVEPISIPVSGSQPCSSRELGGEVVPAADYASL